MSMFESEMTGPANELVNTMIAEAKNGGYLNDQQIDTVKSLTDENVEELPPPLTKENKMWILNTLGLSPRGKGLWYHPIFGEDYPFNTVRFDLETDDIRVLINHVYRFGMQTGTFQLKNKLKSLLDIK